MPRLFNSGGAEAVLEHRGDSRCSSSCLKSCGGIASCMPRVNDDNEKVAMTILNTRYQLTFVLRRGIRLAARQQAMLLVWKQKAMSSWHEPQSAMIALALQCQLMSSVRTDWVRPEHPAKDIGTALGGTHDRTTSTSPAMLVRWSRRRCAPGTSRSRR